MKKIIKHLQIYIFRGFLALVPLVLSFLVLKFFYVDLDQKVVGFIEKIIGFRIPGLGILLILVTLYLIGYLASNVIGKRFFNLIEKILNRIPIIKTTYQIGKQVSVAFSLPEKQIFKRVVLVEYFRPGTLTIGFVTGFILDKANNEKLLKVFIPTVPNPTSGMFVILQESKVIDPGWSIEQAMKIVISGGIIGPEEIRVKKD